MNARSNGANQAAYTRRANAGLVHSYRAAEVTFTLTSGEVVTGFCWAGPFSMLHTYPELRAYLLNTPREQWLTETVYVGPDRNNRRAILLADVQRGGEAV